MRNFHSSKGSRSETSATFRYLYAKLLIHFFFSAILLSSCGDPSSSTVDTSKNTLSAEEFKQAKQLYNFHCSMCHGLDAKGDFGSDIRGKSLEDIKEAIEVESFMRSLDEQLTEDELYLISRYLKEI